MTNPPDSPCRCDDAAEHDACEWLTEHGVTYAEVADAGAQHLGASVDAAVGRETIPFEPVGDEHRQPLATQIGGIKYWAFDSDADSDICLARIRGILKHFDPEVDRSHEERMATSAVRTFA